MADTSKGGYFGGMTNNSPKSSDASTTPKGESVDTNPVRSGVAPTPKTLGPRTA